MKTYYELEDGGLRLDNRFIPPTASNNDYAMALEEVEEGKAVIEPYVAPDTRPEEERQWRNSELTKTDIELYKLQDGMGTGSIEALRLYRNALRKWPENANFQTQLIVQHFNKKETK